MPNKTFQAEILDNLGYAVYPSFAMLAGMQLELFTSLKDGPLTAEQIATSIGASAERLKPLLYALVTTNLLTVSNEQFENSPEADYFLVRGKPSYRGGSHEILSDLWNATLQTAESIRTNKPQAKHDFFHMDEAELESFFRGLHPGAMATGRALARRYDFNEYETLLDVGGGSGGLAIAMTEMYSKLQATVVDLPLVIPIAQRFIEESGAAERIQVMTADVTCESLNGSYDVAIMLNFTQTLSSTDARAAIKNVSDALKPGGVLHIIAAVLDDSRTTPIETVGLNLIFLNLYDGGQAYTERDYRTWLDEAGFVDIERTTRPGLTSSFLCARKK